MLLASGVLPAILGSPCTAHAFAPDAARAVVSRTVSALPAPVAGNTLAAAQDALARRIALESADPERYTALHRYDLTQDATPVPGLAPGDDPGDAPRAFANATAALRSAFSSADPVQWADPLARLATAASDLSDPLQMTAWEGSPAAVHARFVELLDPQTIAAAAAPSTDASSIAPADAMTAALALARESASRRAQLDALDPSDAAGVVALQRERVLAGAALARAAVLGAWREAQSKPATAPLSESPTSIRVWPNPVHESAGLSFAAPRAGIARLELFDLAGRRTTQVELGRFLPGPHRIEVSRDLLGVAGAGVYFARIEVAGAVAVTRVVLAAR